LVDGQALAKDALSKGRASWTEVELCVRGWMLSKDIMGEGCPRGRWTALVDGQTLSKKPNLADKVGCSCSES
jgi:hypothetical protein